MTKARFTKARKKIAARPDEMLVRYTREERMQAAAQGILLEDPYDQATPGLYPDEQVFVLDTGELIAVSVETYANVEQGFGPAFHGYARWIQEDGQTVQTTAGTHVEATWPVSVDADIFARIQEKHGSATVDVIATDVARLMLGEEPQLIETIPANDEGTETMDVPLINLTNAAKHSANIRTQLEIVRQTNGLPTLKL